MSEQHAIEAARKGRLFLRDALCGLEEAIETPLGIGTRWFNRVADSLGVLASAIGAHSADIESEEGLFAVIVRQAPRLSGPVTHVRRGHSEVRAEVNDLIATLGSAGTGGMDPEEIRSRASELITRIIRLRQKSADMAYDAFAIDIGGPA